MSYTIEVSEDKRYIFVTAHGMMNNEIAMKQNVEAHALGKQLGINRILVDLRDTRNTDSTLEQYNFAYKDMKESKDIDKTAMVSIVVSEGDHSHDFIEVVARNSGLNVKLFNDLEQAKQHLLSYPSGK